MYNFHKQKTPIFRTIVLENISVFALLSQLFYYSSILTKLSSLSYKSL